MTSDGEATTDPSESVGEIDGQADPTSTTRRGVMAALVGGGTSAAAASPVDDLLGRIAPLGGGAWQTTGSGPDTVESPYGRATVTYDDHHVPHVEADTEAAAYFGVGYAQAADRLFQMDFLRRDGSGRLAEVLGPLAAERDVLREELDFLGAASASREAIAGTEAERMAAAYADGVSAYVERGPPGPEFGLLEYRPEPWSVLDTLLVAMAMYKQQAWGATATLRRTVLRETFEEDRFETLYPSRLDHGAPVIRDGDAVGTAPARRNAESDGPSVDPTFVDRLAAFDGPEGIGSNAWTVPGTYTDSGKPILCNDPHLPGWAPPIFYQQHVSAGDATVRGVTIPGLPFVLVGENDHGAWGFTSAAATDVLDCYAYDVDGEQYRYGDEWRHFETETRTVDVAGGEDREVDVKKTVHGPVIEREVDGETHHVGVAWTPLTGTRTLVAAYGWNTADGIEAFRDATRAFEVPPLHVHYVGDEGNTLYQLAAKVPVRRVDGAVVRGDRVFDGSAGEAEWNGFEPYGRATWEGFVPFEEMPAAVDADYVASANQRATDDPAYPIGLERRYGIRARRIYELLDRAAEEGTTMDVEFVRSVQLDTLDIRARELVPAILDARDRMPPEAEPWLDALAGWDYRMERDSAAALLFVRFYDHFERETWADDFEERGLDRGYWPSEWVLLTLPADSEFFDGDRGAVLAAAVERAVEEIDEAGWETFGDYKRPSFDHFLGSIVPGLNYPRLSTDGTGATVRAVYGLGGIGGSVSAYRMINDRGGGSLEVLAGGNDGSPFSEHYHDQLRLWADGEYTRLDATPDAEPAVTMEAADR